MSEFVKILATEQGVMALGWFVAAGLAAALWRLYRDLKALHREMREATVRHMDNYKQMAGASNEAIKNNTSVMTAIRTRLEMRHE